MAGEASAMDSFSNRVLWQFISGSGVLRPKELIESELNKNKARLLNGLLHYKAISGSPGEALKKERKLSAANPSYSFTLKLSKFLGVDELVCHDIWGAFLVNDYRGSKKTLKQVVSHERHSQSMLLKIRDFYFTERLYLIRCLRHIVVCWGSQHPYRDIYAKFLRGLQDNGEQLQDKIRRQLEAVCNAQLPSIDKNGILMTDAQVLVWVTQNLKEQCELLELVFLWSKAREMDTKTLLSYLNLFKKHGFGMRQNFKHLIDGTTEIYIKRISYLEALIVLEAMDIETAMTCFNNQDFSDYSLSKTEKDFQNVDEVMRKLGTDPVCGPLLLGWAMVRHFYLPSDEQKDAAETQRLCHTALQLGVFKTLLDVLKTEPFSGTSFVAAPVFYLVYKLLYAVLSRFHEDSLGSSTVLYEICGKLLRQPAIADDVWQKDDGLWLLYESAMSYFPLDFSRFINLTVALASVSCDSAKKVKNTLQELRVYTEYLDDNSARDLQATQDPAVFRLATDKRPYPTGEFTLFKGCCGQVVDPTPALLRTLGAEVSGPLMRWEASYNGWSLLLCEIQELLRQVTQGAGMVQAAQVHRVTMVMELIQELLTQDPSATEEFAPFIELSYQLVHRFSVLNPTPLDLVSRAVSCLVCAAKQEPRQVWHKMTQTGLLPYLTENVDDLGEVLSGRGLHPSMLGSIVAGTECTQGRYPLTLSVLTLLTEMVQPFSEAGVESDLQACLLYVLKEVFPLFRKWRYADLAQRKQIGQQCLTLFHKILNLATLQGQKTGNRTLARPSLHEVCIYSLLFTEAGRALIEIVATGVDNVESALVQQGSMTEGGGVDLIELIQLALSVLNRLLLLRSPELPTSPVEQALSLQPAGRQSQHVVATVAQYIYHRHNPRLPTLATLLLKRLAVMSPMSILACLGNDAEPIRDMYLTRLQAVSEDLRMKVAILELLSVCVETQPGLIEIFFDVQVGTADSTAGKKDLQLGRSSCLHTLLTLMDVRKQNTYHCPPDLLRAGLDLVHSLWRGRRETAMQVLRSKQSFWTSVTAPLMHNITKAKEEAAAQLQPTEMKIAAFAFRILAQEIYAVDGPSVDPQLKTCLQELGKAGHITYWSQFVRWSLLSEAETSEKSASDLSDNPTILLLKAWRNFLLVVSRSKVAEDLQLADRLKEEIMAHLLEGLQAQFSGVLSLLKMKLAAIVTALYYTLLKSWISCVKKPAAILVQLRSTVEQTCSSSETLVPAVQIGLVGALTLLLQRARAESASLAPPTIATLLPITCSMLLHSTRQLSPPGQLSSSKTEPGDGKSSSAVKKPDSSADSKLMLQVTVCSLLTEIITLTKPQAWHAHVQEHRVLAAVLVSVEAFMKAKEGLSYVHSVLLMLTAIAQSERGAAMLSLSNLAPHTCLAITQLYTKEDIFSTNVITAKVSDGGPSPSSVTWHGLYCLSVNLYTLMLRRLGFSFLEDALNFLGAHQDRLQQSLELARLSLLDAAMLEAECTCHFLHQMALYRRQWRLHLPQVMVRLLTSMVNMVQTFISLLIRPRYLQHILERGRDADKGKLSYQSSPLLQHQTSTDDVDQPSTQLLVTENRMLRIVARCLAVLRHFSPDLCELLLDQSMDMCEYEPLVDLGFSTPSVDQESPLTFGSLISCVTACLRRLSKGDRSHSPHRAVSPHGKSPRPSFGSEYQVPKPLLLFVMENCLTLAMTQAVRYLREPSLPQRDKQFLKRELGTELNSFLTSLLRHVRRGTPSSPGDRSHLASPQAGSTSTTTATTTAAAGTISTPSSGGGAAAHALTRSLSQTTFSTSHDQHFFKLVQEFVKKVLR